MRDPETSDILYAHSVFTVHADRVQQGDNLALALSPTHLVSNYRSPASATFSRLIHFNVSINEKDNELPPGIHHWVVVGDGERQSPVITFGERPEGNPPLPPSYLPVNVPYTFRIDVSPVLNQFRERGYYETYDCTRIAEADFKGFYLAGGSEPLTWDYVSLEEHGLRLMPTGEGDIYSLTVTLNPYHPVEAEDREWRASLDLSDQPQYHSDQPLVDALFNLAREEARRNIEADGTFRTGAEWGGVWTRDISYSILLSLAFLEPEVAKNSLRRKVKRGRIVQDTGSGGAWPVSTDRTTWVLAAWEIYRVTGEGEWLREVFPIIRDTLEDDRKTLRDPATGLYRGESSFLDWREQTYPKWMTNADIFASLNLGTNAVHYRAHRILAEMARELGESPAPYDEWAEEIRAGINDHLWSEERGYYGQYRYGRSHPVLSDRFEALGEALSILFGVADVDRARSIVARSPLTPFGVSCIYPQIPGISPYHNNGIWPFVQAYWNLAAARTGKEAVLSHGLAAIYRAAGLFLTNYENMVADTGDFLGTEINSRRMLWSIAGNLAMVYRVFLGMEFTSSGLRFSPAVPRAYAGRKSLTKFRYRQATLSVSVEGYGNRIAAFLLDGEAREEPLVPSEIQGEHTVLISLSNEEFSAGKSNPVPNAFSLPTPRATRSGGQLVWPPVAGAQGYRIYRNGKPWQDTHRESVELSAAGDFAVYQVSAHAEDGLSSFLSEPVWRAAHVIELQVEDFAPAADLPYTGFSGAGFVEVSTDLNRCLELEVTVERAGDYLVDVRFANGSGPVNTDNQCAIRSLYVNDSYRDVLVFPQRGQDEWSDWGWSNTLRITLESGKNRLHIRFEDWNHNMNVAVNRAMLDVVRLIAVGKG
ncbi:hypothetical protein GGR26_003494 [Lewinella marina]|uniref:Glycogen debranching protein n=1 Tax=Neolewinella marina TaxID=438751 RepID=A0A2G0CCC2_9BACT|nr:amylo-alpha-1,6-glucosidase [Neolewinella marina]NJB87710.1 hypothetical protein [Neolewinella marina]PHK97611.1 glycogen debranching protein [Neolewinella marina]